MEENNNSDDKNKYQGLTDPLNLEEENNPLKNELQHKHILIEEKQSNAAVILLCIIIFLFTLFNIFLVEFEKYELNKIALENEKVTNELQAKLDLVKEEIAKKNNESREIADFTEVYKEIRGKFYLQINIINEAKEDNPASMEKYIGLVKERIKAAQDYKDSINSIFIPEVIKNFTVLENDFIDSDIKLWNEVLNYYSLADNSQYDADKISKMAQESSELGLDSKNELIDIYKQHELEYFLNELAGIDS